MTTHHTSPQAASKTLLPCVWMKAGLVAYKLCDHGFDCGSCPFDAAMSGAISHRSPPRRAGDFRADRRYHPGHTWAQARRAGRWRCGVDAFAARLLTGLDGVILPTVGSRLHQGRAGVWIASGSDLVAVRAPCSGRVVRRNEHLRAWPALATAAPYDDGWLLELTDVPEALDETLLRDAAMAKRTESQQRELREALTRWRSSAVGPTLADGGEAAVGLRAVLGRRRYLELVREMLGTSEKLSDGPDS